MWKREWFQALPWKSLNCPDTITLDEALLHLREIITSEIHDPGGPLYWEYDVSFDPTIAANKRPAQYRLPQIHAKAWAKNRKLFGSMYLLKTG